MTQAAVIDASPEAFINDVCLCQVSYNRYIRLYNLNEDFRTSNGIVPINKIMCELLVVDEEGNTIGYSLPNVIGMSNSVFGIKTDTPSLEGQLLTMENIKMCVLEYYNA